MSNDALVPALVSAQDPAAMLAKLGVEDLKPLAKELAGMKRIGADADPEALRARILEGLAARHAVQGRGPLTVGDTITDADGTELTVTPEFVGRVRQISLNLQQGEFAMQQGLLQIATALRDFRAEKGYLLFGFPSWEAYCTAGQLRVMDETRTKRWADGLITIVETLGEEATAAFGVLPRRTLRKLTTALREDGMEAALEGLRDKGILTVRGQDGRDVVLSLPKTPAEAEQWQDAIEALDTARRAAQAAARDAQEDAAQLAELHAKELEELRQDLAAKEAEIAELSGLGPEEVQALLDKDAKALTPAETAKLQKALHGESEKLRQAVADRAELTRRRDDLAGRLDARVKAAAAVGSLKAAQEATDRATRHVRKAMEQMAELRTHAADLPEPALAHCEDVCIGFSSQFEQLLNTFVSARAGALEG